MEEKKKAFEIDVFAILQKIVVFRWFIIRNCILTGIIALIIAFSIPKTYSVDVALIPEISNTGGLSGSVGALASMAGINLGNSTGEDALYPELYPEIVSSIPFLAELYGITVHTSDGEDSLPMSEYLDKHQREPWWSYILGLPGKAIGAVKKMFSKENVDDKSDSLNIFRLNKSQVKTLKAIKKMLFVSIDKQTGLISLSVTTQDPLVSAEVADTVVANLQRYIIQYRTQKARNDYEQIENLYKTAKDEYYQAQNNYARFVDSNQNINRAGFRTEQDRLENDMELAFSVYNQLAQQLQMAKAKVLEETPVYTVIQPASVPLKASAPRKLFILLGFEFMAVFLSIAWLVSRDFVMEVVASLRKTKSESM